MEWPDLIAKLGLTGTSAMMAFAIYTLWKKVEAKDLEIARLNAERAKDLLRISRGSDDE